MWYASVILCLTEFLKGICANPYRKFDIKSKWKKKKHYALSKLDHFEICELNELLTLCVIYIFIRSDLFVLLKNHYHLSHLADFLKWTGKALGVHK